jgi:hypothetical protein
MKHEKKPQMNADKRTINTFGQYYLNGAGVATPDPGEAPPLAGFNMKHEKKPQMNADERRYEANKFTSIWVLL